MALFTSRPVHGKLCDMDTLSPGQVAATLGTSRKRVTAAAERLGLGNRTSAGWIRFTQDDLIRLQAHLGVRERVIGLSTTESQVLATLARRPRGAVSRRAVATMSGLSPTTASKAINALISQSLVYEREETRALSQARNVTVIYANRQHPQWHRLNAELDHITPPHRVVSGSTTVPSYLRHAFWNLDDTTMRSLRADTDGPYIAARALSSVDPELLGWAAENLAATAWLSAAQGRGRTPADRALAINLANAVTHAV